MKRLLSGAVILGSTLLVYPISGAHAQYVQPEVPMTQPGTSTTPYKCDPPGTTQPPDGQPGWDFPAGNGNPDVDSKADELAKKACDEKYKPKICTAERIKQKTRAKCRGNGQSDEAATIHPLYKCICQDPPPPPQTDPPSGGDGDGDGVTDGDSASTQKTSTGDSLAQDALLLEELDYILTGSGE